MSSTPNTVFVYGTLKRGQLREACWLRQPVAVETATVRGAIYDLGSYPALVGEEEKVVGELWRFAEPEVKATLAALDEVEGFRGVAVDEYRRGVVECQTSGGIVPAWACVYARADNRRAEQKIKPNRDGLCRWTRKE